MENFYMPITTRTLEARAARVSARIDSSMARHTQVSSYTDEVTGDLVYQMNRLVYQEFAGTRTIRVPADWIEAVKARFAPAWLLRRYPLRTRDITAEFYASFPDYEPPPGFPQMVRVMSMKQSFAHHFDKRTR